MTTTVELTLASIDPGVRTMIPLVDIVYGGVSVPYSAQGESSGSQMDLPFPMRKEPENLEIEPPASRVPKMVQEPRDE